MQTVPHITSAYVQDCPWLQIQVYSVHLYTGMSTETFKQCTVERKLCTVDFLSKAYGLTQTRPHRLLGVTI